MRLTHFSLFTGIGGIDLAAEWAGFKTVGQCEFADFPTKVLEKNFPNVTRWRDVRNVTNDVIRDRGIRNITLLSAGFPCQPHSLAGKRQASADERDLWGEVARCICEIKPRWFLGENVPGLLTSENGRFFGRILNDLDKAGYNVGWCSYGASDMGAPHRRERVFIVAYRKSERGTPKIKQESSEKKQIEFGRSAIKNNVRNSNSITEPQANKTPITIGINGEAWESITGKYWRTSPTEYWTIHKSPVCGVDDGTTGRFYKDRMKALGNMVVPQQVYPILKCIAEIESNNR